MFASVSILALAIASAQTAVTPLTPATINEGQQLNVQWTPDTTGTWKNVSIDLMSGSNWDMNVVAPITSNVDGTATPGSFEWTVPAVNPNSGIYFIQFTNNGVNPTWTTRFAIASSSGDTTQPTESVQPDGQDIAWGTGALEGQALPVISGASSAMSSSMASESARSSSSSASMDSASSSSMSSSMSSSASSSSQAVSRSSQASSASNAASSATPTVSTPASSAAGLQVAGMGMVVAFVVGLLAA